MRTAEHLQHAHELLTAHPLIDSHVDLPYVMRAVHRRPVETVSMLTEEFPGHVDIPRMRIGKVGGMFMSVWIPCEENVEFLNPDTVVRDALEQIDLIKLMIRETDFEYCWSSADVKKAFGAGKFATLIGVEGAHMLGNSLGVLRCFAELGIRYLTLTHTNHNAFASSAGSGGPIEACHSGNGLSGLGKELIYELNRLGIMVDLSHVSDDTMRDTIKISRAPIMFSHSNARSLCDHPRNVPDDVLDLIGDGPGKNNGVVQVVFVPKFTDSAEEKATLERVADHIEYIGQRCGRSHVGISSDFDGVDYTVKGLEDATTYPDLIAEMISRGWSDNEVIGLMGGNLMRVMDDVDEIAKEMEAQGCKPSSAILEDRIDLPMEQDHELPEVVSKYLRAKTKEGTLRAGLREIK